MKRVRAVMRATEDDGARDTGIVVTHGFHATVEAAEPCRLHGRKPVAA